MLDKYDIKRVQTAVGSQDSGNKVVGSIGLKGGCVVNSSGAVIAGSTSGQFTFIPDSSGTVGAYRAYLNFPAGAIQSIDFIEQSGFSPRSPSASETTILQCTGYNIDVANNLWYITVQQATFAGVLQGSLPSKFVIGVQCAVTFAPNANPL